jgi:uncharacterized C2H2 Zn-finger protein
MTGILSKCIICGKFFDSKKQLRTHKDKDHRITDSKMRPVLVLEKTRSRLLLLQSKRVIGDNKTSQSQYC